MALTELAGVSIFVTLFLQSLEILGESVLASETDKDTELKATEKRLNNFRVPVEMPYDPNFWPARGRRGRYPEKGPDSDICDAYRCPGADAPEDQPGKRRWPQPDPEPNPFARQEDDSNGQRDRACYEAEAWGGGLVNKPRDPDLLLSPKRLDTPRHKKQRHFRLPQIILYGNGVLWRSPNPYAEKKKKEDIFWVARGKKDLPYQE